jgi:hypothetical protein
VKGDADYSLAVRPGDYNADGSVDAADYIVWRKAMSPSGGVRADGNGDGIVDTADYDVWRSQFGSSYSMGANAVTAVPEPATAWILLTGAAATLLVRRPATRR